MKYWINSNKLNSASHHSLAGFQKLLEDGHAVVPNGVVIEGVRTNTLSAFKTPDGSTITSPEQLVAQVGSLQGDGGGMEMSLGTEEEKGAGYTVGQYNATNGVVMNVTLLPGVSATDAASSFSGSFEHERGVIMHGPVVYLITNAKLGGGVHQGGSWKPAAVTVDVSVIPQSLYEAFNYFEGIQWTDTPPVLSMPQQAAGLAQNGPSNVPGAPTNVPAGQLTYQVHQQMCPIPSNVR